MRTIAFHTLGCKVNQAESDELIRACGRQGFTVVPFDGHADVYVINTCTVTNLADRRSRQTIRHARRKNPAGIVAVTGCYAQRAPREIGEIPGVSLIVPHGEKVFLLDRVRELLDLNHSATIPPSAAFPSSRTRALLKVQDGCPHGCSYCVIPSARGKGSSSPPGEVCEKLKSLIGEGSQEIVLTGIDLGSYGRDLNPRIHLADLLLEVAKIPRLPRVRLSSIDPRDCSERLLGTLRTLPWICPHIHLPLQSGSDRVLRAMKRGYTRRIFLEKVSRIRELLPATALTTDVMVGFPGEEESDFLETCDVVREAGFSKLHVFPYSERPGTESAAYPEKVPEGVKEGRCRSLLGIGHELSGRHRLSMVGKVAEVVVEHTRESEGELLSGVTGDYARVFFFGDDSLVGKRVQIRITGLFRSEAVEGVVEGVAGRDYAHQV
ncbi:MAG: tRNA (N(6)-L-threonylcarbamoyladenosine(37)-C(2))-methylthiotransferase MtaB [Armatimonadetes bacterium]|nr:tRNA (N(6)-L-threonylcarbamoyladenosine(37)-C(2))-methylthiotransferase MtaB [Armatimonadota bacterium]